MMKKELINIFPLTLYKSSIEISESEKKILIDEVYSMEKEIVTEKRTNSAWTGDVKGHEFLFNNKKFKILFDQIEDHIKSYLESLGIDLEKIDIFYQRAWATISRGEEYIVAHKHTQSHISFAYYLKKEDSDSQIAFFDKIKHNEIIPNMFSSPSVTKKKIIKNVNNLTASIIKFNFKENDIVIFPSKTVHGTEFNKKNNERISLSADIMVTAKDSSGLEHMMPSIDKWKKFKD